MTSDIVDKVVLIGLGIEKKLKDTLNDLTNVGKEVNQGAEKELPPKQELENRLVEEGVKMARELISVVKIGKEKVDKEIEEILRHLIEKFRLVSRDDIEIIEKMAQLAREKVDRLEKRVEELEKKIGK